MQPPPCRSSLTGRAGVLLLLATGALACPPGGTPGDTASASDARASTRAMPEPLRSRPGDDADEWGRHRSRLGLLAQTELSERRQCVGTAEDVQSAACLLEITPLDSARQLDWDALDSLGVIVATIRNRGPKREALLNVAGRQRVYWNVYRRDVAPGVTVFVSQFVDSATGIPLLRPSHRQWNAVDARLRPDEFPFKWCGTDTDSSGTSTAARFTHCSHRHPAPGVRADGRGPLNNHNSPPWISCTMGCCAVEQLPGDSLQSTLVP